MKQTMYDAYKRELALLPIIIEMETKGIPLSKQVHAELEYWEAEYDNGKRYLSDLCGEVEVGSKAMFELFAGKGLLDTSKLTYTAKGNPQYGRDKLPDLITDPHLLKTLLRRSKLQKVLGTYLRPWAEAATKNDYRLFPFFSQTRGDDDYGTRTGRMSSNVQQMPKEPADDMPNLRKMIVAEEGNLLIQRDFSSQEVRVAAHFAEGNILQAFIDNPDLDAHEFVGEMIKRTTGRELPRKVVKAINFLKLYGGGPKALLSWVDTTEDEARMFFSLYDQAIPEFKQLAREVERMVRGGTPIRTWGGRLYDVEPAKIVDGKRREFYYKLLNVLVQGSSADMSKEAMLRYHNHPDRHPDSRILLVVHDEIVLTCPEREIAGQMELLRWAMDEIPGWDVPIRSDGAVGKNFGELKDYEEK